MSTRIIRTAVAKYDDGSEGVIAVKKLTPEIDDPFIVLDNPDGGSAGLVIGTHDQAKQLAKAILAAAKETFPR